MGSLMAGWSTKPSRAEDALKRTSSSLTKEEVDKYWRSKRSSIQEHLEEAHRDAALSPRASRAISIASQRRFEQAGSPGTVSLPTLSTRSDWWTKSNWAFLNDPPAVEGKQSHYTAQFDIATKGHMAHHHPTRSMSALSVL